MFGEAYLDTDISDSNLSYRTTNLLFLYFCHVHWNQESDIFFVKEESILKKKGKNHIFQEFVLSKHWVHKERYKRQREGR